MAVLSTNTTTEFAVVRWFNDAVASFRLAARRNAEFNRVYVELSSLSDRELEDIGIARSAIKDIAKASAAHI